MPNLLTLFRLLAAPIIFLCLSSQQSFVAWITLVLFTLAAFTDFLDGYLSRRWQVESWLGKVMDPIADKLLVISVLIGLIAFRSPGLWVTVLIYILIVRELLVGGLREVSRHHSPLAVSVLGKAKTSVQFVALFVILAEFSGSWPSDFGIYLLAAATMLSVMSMLEYLVRFIVSETNQDSQS